MTVTNLEIVVLCGTADVTNAGTGLKRIGSGSAANQAPASQSFHCDSLPSYPPVDPNPRPGHERMAKPVARIGRSGSSLGTLCQTSRGPTALRSVLPGRFPLGCQARPVSAVRGLTAWRERAR